MTVLTRILVVLLAVVTIAPVAAQEKKKKPPPLRIERVRLGLPAGASDAHRVRLGAWNPVYVDLEAGENDVGQGDYLLVGETSDGESQSVFTSSVPAISAERTRIAITYYRPGDRGGRLTLSLRKRSGTTVQTVTAEPRDGTMLAPHEVLYLGIGSSPAGIRTLFQRKGPALDVDDGNDRTDQSVALIDRAAMMPARWYGYQSADVIVLTTYKDSFVQELRQNEPALAALGEWVRRGGRLVLSVGRNVQTVRELLPRLGLTDFKLEKSEAATTLPGVANWAKPGSAEFPGKDGIDVARISVSDGVIPLATDERDGKSWPILSMSTAGTGRILFVAFDFDAPGFARWAGQSSFWDQIDKEMAPQSSRGVAIGGNGRSERAEIAANLQRGLENFEEVPVISFGWVAFFILIYIIIVGPLDYWFLKKVVKRLELTWVTFPLVVLIVSVAAYFTAYKLKGNHMRINKVDVVDVNLRDGEVNGTTWLALFSPRVQAYTVGIAPSPDWVGGGKEDDNYGALAGTLNTPDSSIGGLDRPASQSLFRRPYTYADDAKGLHGVPVPVWASRSFTASWRAKVEPGRLVEVKDFGPSRDGQHLIGTITNHLPVELTEVSLLYNGSPHLLGNLPVGGAYSIEANGISFSRDGGGLTPGAWLQKPFRHIVKPRSAKGRGDDPDFSADGSKKFPGAIEEDVKQRGESLPVDALMKSLLFFSHDAIPEANRHNGGLRMLDQGWRLRGVHSVAPRDERRFLPEAILIGRVIQTPATAETVAMSGVSPTRLWLGTLPGEGDREPLQGFLGQDTYVRIYIPVAAK